MIRNVTPRKNTGLSLLRFYLSTDALPSVIVEIENNVKQFNDYK